MPVTPAITMVLLSKMPVSINARLATNKINGATSLWVSTSFFIFTNISFNPMLKLSKNLCQSQDELLLSAIMLCAKG